MHQSVVASAIFWLFLLSICILGGIPPASAYPVSLPLLPRGDISTHTLSAVQQRSPSILLPRDLENTEPEDTPPTGIEVVYASESKTTGSPKPEASDDGDGDDDNDDNDDESTRGGLNPNIISGIAVGSGFFLLLLIAALMYAFRVGWEKGQKQKEREMVQNPPKLPEPLPSEHWKQVDVIRPPEVVLGAGKSCWDSGSWSSRDEHMERYKPLGERYSFRPGKGVYEIQNKDEKAGEIAEIRPRDPNNRTDSGLGLDKEKENEEETGEEEGKGKGPERL